MPAPAAPRARATARIVISGMNGLGFAGQMVPRGGRVPGQVAVDVLVPQALRPKAVWPQPA